MYCIINALINNFSTAPGKIIKQRKRNELLSLDKDSRQVKVVVGEKRKMNMMKAGCIKRFDII